MTHKAIHWCAEFELLDIKLPNVIYGLQPITIVDVWPCLIIALKIVIVLINPTNPTNSHALFSFLHVHNATWPQIVYVLCDPPSIVKISQQVWGLVIAPNKECQNGSSDLSVKEPVKLSHLFVLWGTFQGVHVSLGPQTLHYRRMKKGTWSTYLKVTWTNDEVYLFPCQNLPLTEFLIEELELAMQTSNYSNYHF